ncbi:MAG: CGGC domain-containing protein [Clostridium lundense]|nr:CGGC domain-containing protein [Clostridium lundense]
MKIAIIACENTNGTCSTMGCFKAYNNRNKAFSIYEKDEDLEMMAFATCDACSKNSDENLLKTAKKLQEAGVKRIHLAVCIIKKCKANRAHEIKQIFENHNIEVIEGTH